MRTYLSVVIPAYNEVNNLKRGVLNSVYEYLSSCDYKWEVLVVDDGSSDETAEMVESFAKTHKDFRLMREPHRGKGGTVIAGMLEAKGDLILFADMDQSTPIDQVEKLIAEVNKGADIAIGSRKGRPGQPIVRKIMAYGWMILRTLILRLPYKDTQCGFKLFRREVARKIFKKMKIFNDKIMEHSGASVTAAFDLEILYIARKIGYKVSEVPVEWYEYGERRAVNPIKDSYEGLRDLLKVRWNAIKGEYE